jgi:phosphoribosylaminoimidazole (AIR) synthetase
MILIVAREQAEDVIDRLQALGERATRIGEIEAKQPDEPAILFAPPSQQRG